MEKIKVTARRTTVCIRLNKYQSQKQNKPGSTRGSGAKEHDVVFPLTTTTVIHGCLWVIDLILFERLRFAWFTKRDWRAIRWRTCRQESPQHCAWCKCDKRPYAFWHKVDARCTCHVFRKTRTKHGNDRCQTFASSLSPHYKVLFGSWILTFCAPANRLHDRQY